LRFEGIRDNLTYLDKLNYFPWKPKTLEYSWNRLAVDTSCRGSCAYGVSAVETDLKKKKNSFKINKAR